MKRKHPSSAAPVAAPSSVRSQAAARKGAVPSGFARPMRRLDQSQSDEEEEDHERARSDRKHIKQIEQDADADDDDVDMGEDDDDDSDADASEAEEDVDAEEQQDENDDEDGEDDDADEEDGVDVDEDAADDDTPAEPILEYDLPFQVVQGTYSGVLYGLKSKHTLRELRAYHNKLHSKGGIEEADMENDDDDDVDDAADDDDDLDAEEAEAMKLIEGDAASPADTNSAISTFDLLFTNAAHIGSTKSLAISADGKWMVSGGMDETIKIYKTAVMREFGQLHSHTGSVAALEFYGNSFLLSGGQEGDLCIWSTKTWQLLRKFTAAHVGTAGSTGGVSCLSVHPSGRVALSVGATDRKVKLWDLMKGTLASERKLDFACTSVKWSPNGEQYAIVGDKRFDIYDTASTLIRREQVTETKLLSAVWLSSELLALGCEDKTVRVHLAATGECVSTLQAHQARVRALDCLSVAQSSDADASCTFLASSDTTGQTYLWDLTELVAAFSAGAAGGSSHLHAFHPCCQSFHDQRVTLLRILPHFAARKDDRQLQKPVQTQAAQEKQHELEAKKAAAATKADRADARLAKSKALFEKSQRSHAAKEAAAAKAKRTLARLAPGAAEEEEENANQQPKKKAKPTFEEAPQYDSDQEQNQPQQYADEDDDSDDDEPPPAPFPKKPAAAPKAASATPPAKSTKKPKSSPPAKKNSRPNLSAKQAATAAAHAGFSAALPMFKPKLNDQRKKKKSAQKVQRDANRARANQQR